MTTVISQQELYDSVMIVKKFLNRQIVKHRTGADGTVFSLQEIYTRLDLIHESERKGFRHLDSRYERKLIKLVNEVSETMPSLNTEEEGEIAVEN